MFFIKSAMNLVKVLKIDCNLAASNIQNKISLLFKVILLVVKNQDCQIKIIIYQNLIFTSNKNIDML